MTEVIADTSALVSLGIADGCGSPLRLLETEYDLSVPDTVYGELEETALYDDVHGQAASRVLELLTTDQCQSVELDQKFPLDDGENAAVSLANSQNAEILLCDEFNSLGLIHASLADTRLVTTPVLLSSFSRNELLTPAQSITLLDSIAAKRSWEENSYVQRTRARLETD
ncbi:hypothetical protein SAMN04487967_0917 [Natronorubrum sediminis]|uniref:PIN domain-containing protein n=1 Tax=Natronorubrum sediminis TaxID=640943 RepID=A0A1H6FP60_9EURY|nr:hypothetical protein [Natronorubrum sediminis]SEH12687.1 hypothetical protein SAMN04487967_0917 [Natronorubrum sediminis]